MRDLTLVFRKERDDKKIWRQKCVPSRSHTQKDPLSWWSAKFRNHSPVRFESKSRPAASVIATPWSKMGRGQASNIRAFRDMKSLELLTQSGQALPAGRPVNELVLVGMAGTADIAIVVDGVISSRAR